MTYIWFCAYCGDEFDYDKGYNKEKGIVICPKCKSDDTHFHKEVEEDDLKKD